MKSVSMAAVGGAFVGMIVTAGVLNAQQPVPVAAETTPITAPRAVVQTPGSVQITRLTDTSFVIVKDQGDAQVVTLFTTEAGLVQKKHAGRFLY